MIRPLRRVHRAVAIALAALLPTVFALALASRPEPASFPTYPAKTRPEMRAGRDAFGRLVLELDARGTPVVPDALVYWAPAAASAPQLPPDAVLIGAMPANEIRSFNLPWAAHERSGVAFVFSLAWQKRVAELALGQVASAGVAP